MKPPIQSLLTAIMATLFIACETENLTPSPLAITYGTGEPGSDCAWSPCDEAIEAVKREYQPLANSLCDTVWVDITCCHDGVETCALVYIAPGCQDVPIQEMVLSDTSQSSVFDKTDGHSQL